MSASAMPPFTCVLTVPSRSLGSAIAARIANTARTSTSSIQVKPAECLRMCTMMRRCGGHPPRHVGKSTFFSQVAAASTLPRTPTTRTRRASMLKPKVFRTQATFLCSLGIALAPLAAPAQTKPTCTELGGDSSLSIHWVGNSFSYYNNSMHGHYRELANSLEPKAGLHGVSVTISGSGIAWHDMDTYLKPGLIGKYSFVPGNKIVFNKEGRQFDAVMMMDCSQCPVHPDLKPVFHQTAKSHIAKVVKYGARPVLFMSWAYKDAPEMTARLAEQHTIAGNANDALVVPAGLAFTRAIDKRPGPELYAKDKRHPSLAGTHLGAATTNAPIAACRPWAGPTRRASIRSSPPSCRRWHGTR
jgi:hypothetical protein